MQAIRDVYFFCLFNMAAFFGLVVLALWFGRKISVLVLRTDPLGGRKVHVLEMLLLATATGTGVIATLLYISVPCYVDHVEPQLACAAASYLRGVPIHHAPDADIVTGLGYGPLLYLCSAAALKVFGESLTATKLPGFLTGLASVLLVLQCLRSATNLRESVRASLWFFAASLAFLHALIWTRSDPYLVFCASLALWAALRLPCIRASIVVGLMIGLACNLKIHGGVYCLGPILILIGRHGWRAAAAATAPAFVGAFGVFLIPGISLPAYCQNLLMVAEHGLSGRSLLNNVQWMLFLFVPALFPLFRRGRGFTLTPSTERRYLLAGHLVGCMLVAVVASKPGAGPWHFLPFLPGFFYLYFCPVREQQAANQVLPESVATMGTLRMAWLTVITLLVITRHDGYITRLWNSDARNVVNEVHEIMHTYAGRTVQMGYGDALYGHDYEVTFYRPELVFGGHPFTFDASALMERDKAGIPFPAALVACLEQGEPQVVLVPKGNRPFRQLNFYTGQPMFPREFVATFERDYQIAESLRYYDVWITRQSGGR
ncbi:MAG: hypothetical protein HQ582_07265 [Planctomycetes bacterium]|nr:hypothetical protein [Planctomycetota bacterium]